MDCKFNKETLFILNYIIHPTYTISFKDAHRFNLNITLQIL